MNKDIKNILTAVKPEMIRMFPNIPDEIDFYEFICRDSRKHEVCFSRQVCYYFVRTTTSLGLKSIGNLFGRKDHSTVLHACNTVNNLCDSDKKIKAMIDRLTERIELALNGVEIVEPIKIDISYTFSEFDKREVLN